MRRLPRRSQGESEAALASMAPGLGTLLGPPPSPPPPPFVGSLLWLAVAFVATAITVLLVHMAIAQAQREVAVERERVVAAEEEALRKVAEVRREVEEEKVRELAEMRQQLQALQAQHSQVAQSSPRAEVRHTCEGR
eukprot:COSAG06_NODE_29728_length_551_cov_0.975664_1_plen_136_part_10